MINIGVVFGGPSEEHEVSLASAKAVMKAIDSLPGYKAERIGMCKEGNWVVGEGTLRFLISKADPDMLFIETEEDVDDRPTFEVPPHAFFDKCDYIMPMTHGAIGEDGKLQGFFETLNIPVIGCGTLASAVCFDKNYLKTLLEGHGFKVAPGGVINIETTAVTEDVYKEFVEITGGEKFAIKPNDNGSGIGVSIARNYEEFKKGVEKASKFTRAVLVEKFIPHKEIVVGVIGNGDDIEISHLGESNAEVDNVYEYEAKYNENTFCQCPADISPMMENKIKKQTAEIYKLVGCKDWARIDFFIENETNSLYMNEINTIPGFSPHSVFPKIFESKGVGYTDLVRKIIESAIKHEEQAKKAAAA